MKTIFKITCLLLLIPSVVLANGLKGKYEKTKTIKKEFAVNTGALLELNNKYGSIDIKSWKQNKISIEVIITTSNNKESKAVDKLDAITIEFSNSNSNVSAKTKIGKTSNWGFSNNNSTSMDIKYIVRIPITNNLNVNMDYGDVMIDKIEGRTSFNIEYGKLIAGELLNKSNSINLDYSRGSSIETITDANINIDYSSLDVTNARTIDLNSDYCDTTFENVKDLIFNSDYGNIYVENANNIDGNADYANLKFGSISNSLIIQADYGNLKVNEMGSNFNKINIDSDYIGVKIGVHKSSSFNYIIDSKYGGISLPPNVTNTKEIEKNTSKHYEGTFNGSKGTILINTTYGSVKIIAN